MLEQQSHVQRADARRNRQKVLDAATDLFAEQGLSVHVDDIAKRAGVGVATLFRNFPTKEALIEAVVADMQQDLLDDVHAALAEPDPGEAFKAFVNRVAKLRSRHRVLAEKMATELGPHIVDSPVEDQLRAAIERLVERAQAAGAIRGDVGPADVAMLLAGIIGAAAIADDIEPTIRDRYIAIMWDGLCTPNPTPLPGRPPDLAELFAHKHRVSDC